MAVPKTVSTEVTPEDIQRIVESVNDVWYKVSDVANSVRQLELRVDQFVPMTVNTTITPTANKLALGMWATSLAAAGVLTYLGFKAYQLEKKKAEAETPAAA